jgi:hypothetical protein
MSTLIEVTRRSGRNGRGAVQAERRGAPVIERARPAPAGGPDLQSADPASPPRRWLDPGVDVTIRFARFADAAALAQLAELSSAAPLEGEALAAEVGGELWAACAVGDGRTISDPFRPTTVARSLLHLRRKHLVAARRGHAYGEGVGLRPLRRCLAPLRPAIG